MRHRFFENLLDHPLAVIAAAVLLVAVASAGAGRLVFKSDYRVFFGEENPQLNAYEAMQRVYGKSDNIVFVLSPRSGGLFTPDRLEALRQLTEGAWQIPYSTRVDSITNYQHSRAEGDDLIVEDLVADPLALDAAGLEGVRKIATSEPLLRGNQRHHRHRFPEDELLRLATLSRPREHRGDRHHGRVGALNETNDAFVK